MKNCINCGKEVKFTPLWNHDIAVDYNNKVYKAHGKWICVKCGKRYYCHGHCLGHININRIVGYCTACSIKKNNEECLKEIKKSCEELGIPDE